MKKRLVLLFISFIAFYYLLHLAYYIPDFIHGNSRFAWLPGGRSGVEYQLEDIFISFCFTLGPYLLLFRLYPDKTVYCLLLILICILLFFLFDYSIEKSWT